MIKRGSLVIISKYTPVGCYLRYALKFRSIYERNIIWNALSELIKLEDAIFNIHNPDTASSGWIIHGSIIFGRRKGRKYYNFPRRNRIFMSIPQFNYLLHNSYDILMVVSSVNLLEMQYRLFMILEKYKFIPGTIRYGVNKSSDPRYRCCFKAITNPENLLG